MAASKYSPEEKARKLARRRELYALNPQKMIDKTKRYYEKNKEKVSARTKAQRLRDRDTILVKRRAYREKNRELLNEKQRLRAKLNPDKIRASFKKWADKNKQRLILDRKSKRASDPEKARLYSRLYYGKNREKLIAVSSEWRRKNPEREKKIHADFLRNNRAKIYAKISKRKAKQLSQLHPLSSAEKINIYYEESIRMKQATGIIHSVDHIIPIAKNGWHHEDNLQVMPKKMNSSKNNKPFWLAPHMGFMDWRDVPRELWPIELAPKYLALIEENRGKSIRWDTAA